MNTNYNNYTKILLLICIAAFTISSCKKDRPADAETKTPEISRTKGIYMLCEGLWGMNNSAISYYDIESAKSETDLYKKVNGTNLGETASDLKAYGSKMYCIVSGSQGQANSFVDIIDIATCKSLKRISFNSNNESYLPRFVAFYKNKAYVSRYDGKISRIDTASMLVDGELQLMNGTNKAEGLEGITVANGKIYVTNSSHAYYPNGLKTKVTVIDPQTFTKTKDIEVGNNPVKIATAGNGDVYVVTWNDFVSNNDPTLVRISSVTDAVLQTEKYDIGSISIAGTAAWVTRDVYSDPKVQSIDLTTGKLGANLINDGTTISTLYGVTVNGFDRSVVVADGNNYNANLGKAFVFGVDGRKKYEFNTSGLPQQAVFVYGYK